jgi:hypothetical protein
VVKHTFGPLIQYKFKRTQDINAKKEDKIEEEAATREKKEPRPRNENEILTPPFIVDLLTQTSEEEGSTAGGWAMDRPTQWTRVFQARSTQRGGAAFYVDTDALGEVAASLLRDLSSGKWAQKNVAENIDLEHK